jgi:hypothetical protein
MSSFALRASAVVKAMADKTAWRGQFSRCENWQVTDRKNFAAAWIGLQIAIENFWLKAETSSGRQRYNQSTTVK